MSNIEYLKLLQEAVKPIIIEYKHIVLCSFLGIYSLLLITDGYYFLIFLVLGFILGAFYFNNDDGKLSIDYQRNLVYNESTLEQFSDSLEPAKEVQLFYSPLTTVVNQLLDHVMRDFILSWWTPINEHNDVTFEKLARERLNIVFLNVEKILLNQERNDIVMSTVYGVANTLIIHMRECRALEDSELSINQYVLQNPQSPFSQLLSKDEQHRQLRSLSQIFLKRTLPAQDRDSLLLMSLFRELLANFVFGSILDNLSEPDFLNCWIIELLSEKNNKSTEAIASAVLADNLSSSSSSLDSSNNIIIEEPYSIQVTRPNTPEPSIEPNMIFLPGSVHFTIMDISSPQELDEINKLNLIYIIQIERPAMEDNTGSEGGGYVITRTYKDFETFNSILYSRHLKRTNKLQLRLPLDPSKSWLKSTQQKVRFPLNDISQALEKYINIVVQDIELGTDPIILSFLRKETRSEIGTGGTIISFSEEFKDEITDNNSNNNSNNSNSNGRSKSLFSRNSISSIKLDDHDQWFTKTRNGSISSIHSNLSKPDSPINDIDDERKETLKNKALSPMDVELLIETTYALIVEIFNLTSTNNKAWMRRSILNLLREIVRRTYAEFISEQYSDFVNQYMSPDAIVSMLNKLGDQFWPEGKWMLDVKEQTERTEKDKEYSKQLARSMLMTQVIPNTVRQLIGDQNCNTAMDRIWARCQNTELNRVLILQVIERIIKPILG